MPLLTPVTTPAFVTVATPVLEDVQGVAAAGVPDPVSEIVEPTQTAPGPVIVGSARTVIVTVF